MKLTSEQVKEALVMHFDEITPTRLAPIYLKSLLKEATNDEYEKTYKLKEKSLGHQWVILMGLGSMDTSFHPTFRSK